MSTKEILIKAKALIDTPEKWTQGAAARRADGTETSWASSGATCFCAQGAMLRAVSGQVNMPIERRYAMHKAEVALSVAARTLPAWDKARAEYGSTYVTFNDRATHADVMRAFDVAIASEA